MVQKYLVFPCHADTSQHALQQKVAALKADSETENPPSQNTSIMLFQTTRGNQGGRNGQGFIC